MQNNNRLSIFIFDTNSIISKTLSDFMTDLGYKVIITKSTSQLLLYLESNDHPLRIIILENNIFRRDLSIGLSEVHRRYPNTYFALITDSPSNLSLQEAILYGVYSYFRKPIYLTELELLLFRFSESVKIKK